ncbi:mitotic checkpoint serine/threonine-protein kinase BUB1 beta [Aplochiton taeniatus]
MAEGGDAEWELCKENIQPLKRGRAISALHQALSQQQEGLGTATLQQKQAFESELRVNDGEDPLHVWDRYIKWTEQTFPQGGKESNLTVLLERAVMRFTDEPKYHNDPRYIDLWIKFAEHSQEPLDIYLYMQAQEIGARLASFYIAWAEEHERRGNPRKADTVYQEGFQKMAQPTERLLQFHKALQARVSRQALSGVGQEDSDEDENPEPQRVSLVALKHRGKKKAVAPVNRVGAVLKSQPSSLPVQGRPVLATNSRLVVFDESKAPGDVPSQPKLESWVAPPPPRAKENEQGAEKWCNVKMAQKSRFGHAMVAPPSKPSFQPFVEESDQPPTMTPCKINPVVNTVLSARRPCREETPLKRLQDHQQQQQQQQQPAEGKAQEQSMYCKELLLSGASEFCFEELRAERYRLRMAAGPREGRKDQESEVKNEQGPQPPPLTPARAQSQPRRRGRDRRSGSGGRANKDSLRWLRAAVAGGKDASGSPRQDAACTM